ncbi:UBP-type zinc finger domain-containing protein [Bryobacter aggregatus]|uniref:UBP-type zinc finger domain-containing protein n=1 Tax=Bryobacter aggregatus TaxID=360054 RepID=UPI0004E169FB|nr:UBP-type zinc finger domain-containing protein [Bryobacter aggregatus]
MPTPCAHLRSTPEVEIPDHAACASCIALGDTWIHLRKCAACGHIGCCDSSKNQHATKHFRATSHPVVRAVEDGWYWCYVDAVMVD